MSGSDLDERCKVLEGFTILKSSVWRDPAEDILDPKDTTLTTCEQACLLLSGGTSVSALCLMPFFLW